MRAYRQDELCEECYHYDENDDIHEICALCELVCCIDLTPIVDGYLCQQCVGDEL